MDNPFLILDQRMSRIENILLDMQRNNSQSKNITEDHSTTSLIDTKELCAFLKVTEQTIIRWKKKKKIPFIKVGTSFRFIKKDVIKSLGK